MEATAQKAALRSQLKGCRSRLSIEAIREKSRRIAQRVDQLAVFQAASSIGLYAAKPEEVQTARIYAHAKEAGTQTCFPRVTDPTARHMSFHEVTSMSALRPGYASILEPASDAPQVSADGMALLFIPGVGFDAAGHRLGLGLGYYDKWLPDFKGYRVGLAFECQITEAVPHDQTDEGVDFVVTEERIIECRGGQL